MKKSTLIILVTILTIALLLTFCACNYQILDLNYKFDRAYVKIGEQWHDVEIKSWMDYEGEQIQLTLQDGTVLIVNSMNCVLYNGTLPN